MRKMILCGALWLACMLALPLRADELYVQQHNAQGSLVWRHADDMLELHSDAGSGIVVTSTSGNGVWGLHQGDAILAVNGHHVQKITELVDRLAASKPAPVDIRVRHGAAERVVTMAAASYMQLVGPKPPVPPKPPTPDSVLPPPPPPPPPSGS